jgi:uncharacterized protein (TIGR03118 family)
MSRPANAFALAVAAVLGLAACGGSSNSTMSMTGGSSNTVPAAASFKAAVLVSDGSVSAPTIDSHLRNAWGIVFNPAGFVWVSNNGTQTSTLYDGNGAAQPLVVTLPATASGLPESPTGIVFNSSADFAVTSAGKTGSAVFVWATLQGTLAGWSPKVLATQAVLAYDDGAGAAEYTGLAIANNAGANMLYAADFHNGKIDMFDRTFKKVTLSGAFIDPNLPAGFNPFGIQTVGATIYVTYAKLGPDGHRDVAGAGNGVVDAFDTAGHLVKRIATNGTLNSPWGVAMAPASFGAFSNDLLIGNFGDGTINAFDPVSGQPLGPLKLASGASVTEPGLWGIAFGNGIDNQPVNTLFFATGPSDSTGTYGRVDPTQ